MEGKEWGAGGDGCGEARGGLKKCAEREGDEQKLQAADWHKTLCGGQ